jgi:hypothetical protein
MDAMRASQRVCGLRSSSVCDLGSQHLLDRSFLDRHATLPAGPFLDLCHAGRRAGAPEPQRHPFDICARPRTDERQWSSEALVQPLNYRKTAGKYGLPC